MTNPPTVRLKDIAASAGVSVMTVSAALSERSSRVFISDATRQRVRKLAEEMGYRPNAAARALATGRSNTIEIWAQSVSSPYFNAVYHLARRHLQREYGLNVTLRELAEQQRHGAAPSDALTATEGPTSADGLLIFDIPGGAARLQEMLQRTGTGHLPFVSMGGYHVAGAQYDFVGIDLYAGTRRAIQHLLSVRCGRIAYVVDRASHYESDSRWAAYTETVQQAGIAPEYVVAPQGSRASTRAAVKEYFLASNPGAPDGLFCHNDVMAMGAYRGLCDLGIRVPEEVALVGCDGIEEIEYLERPLSTLQQPADQMCALACQFLHRRIYEPSETAPQQAVLEPELIVRASSQR